MSMRSARFILLPTLALLCIVGLSRSEPRIEIVKDLPSDPRPGTDPRPPRSAPRSPRAGGRDCINTVPKSLTPLTHKATCGSEGAGCCERTRDWCLREGFLWQSCKKCFCGSQCFAPDASGFTQDDGGAAP